MTMGGAMPPALVTDTGGFNDPDIRAAQIPGAGGIATAEALAAIWSATVHETDGVRLLDPSTVELATQTETSGPPVFDPVPPYSRWGMNMVLQKTGHRGTGSDMARSFASYGHRVSGPQVGAIAVMGRRGGGHVGVVSGIDAKGNPIVVSGNHGRRVAESVYPRSRVYAYVMPN